jgi:hypothetical protein
MLGDDAQVIDEMRIFARLCVLVGQSLFKNTFDSKR